MPNWGEPRDYSAADNLRQTEPYYFQRRRDSLHSSYPRPAQANTSQPNAKGLIMGWGLSTQAYWQSVFDDYMKRKKLSQDTSLRMGREL